MEMRIGPVLLVIALATSLGACSKNVSPPPADEPTGVADAGRRAKVLPLPGEAPDAAPAPAGSGPLTWEVPDGWVEVAPASSMRQAQYRVPGPGGDADCIVFYFGPGQGGDASSNAVRWAKQFAQPDGGSSVDVMKMTTLEGTGVPVQLVEVTGIYDGGMTMTDAPAERKSGYMLLGTIAEGPDGPWFFKLTGPEETVRAQRDRFVQMMESLGTGS